MQITFIGVGRVGVPLADHLQQQLGHTVTIAARNPTSQSVQKALALNPLSKRSRQPMSFF